MLRELVRTRVEGTVNLHEATSNQPLDFFLMLSSWNAIFGTPTQSNYLATCTFMDSFARYRRHLGKPATSLNLGPIFDTGTIRRFPDIIPRLTRFGLYGSEINEVICYVDAAINGSKDGLSEYAQYDPLTDAQLLAGIEPYGLKQVAETYPLEQMPWYNDSRFAVLVSAVENLHLGQSTVSDKNLEQDDHLAPSQRIAHKLSQLLYIPATDIDTRTSSTSLGIDSMVAGELRNWLFRTFGKDVSLFQLLSSDATCDSLGQVVSEE